MKELTVKKINEMSYTDFVATINQWNVLPGAFSTLSKWAVYSNLNDKSRVIEVACTTGFKLRELSVLTKCSGVSFDISQKSVEVAKKNKEEMLPNANIEYYHADGYTFQPNEKFTHVILGAGLGFFPDPEKMLDRCISWLHDGGMILASPFYITKPIPKELLERGKQAFGITPTQISYKEIMRSYKHLEIIFEERNTIELETDEELAFYCNSTIEKATEKLKIDDPKIRQALYDRLHFIKQTSNLLRPYQGYTVLVLRYRKSVYPNRFVELF